MSRFDYVAYDETAVKLSAQCKLIVEELEHEINALPASREKAVALTKLEETFMWIGKAIREDQAVRKKYGDTSQVELEAP